MKVIVDNIVKIRETISEISPTTKTLISTIINRFDSKNFDDKIVFVNDRLEQVIPKCDLIDNGNIDRDCIGSKGLHLNRTRTVHLAKNFKQASSDI